MADWQLIETAPSNIAILVFVPNREHYGPGIYRAMYWNHPERCEPFWQSTALASGRNIPADSLPTHWMPLPEPPVSAPPRRGEG